MLKYLFFPVFLCFIGSSVYGQYRNPWSVDISVQVGPGLLRIDEQLPDQEDYLQSPYQVPYDTTNYHFNPLIDEFVILSQGRVDYGIAVDFVNDKGFDIGLLFRTGFVPRSEPRVYRQGMYFDKGRYTRSIELDLSTIQLQFGWDIHHERWNISKTRSLRIKGFIGYSNMRVFDEYTAFYSDSSGNFGVTFESYEAFNWTASGINWGVGLEYTWFPNKSGNGLGFGVIAKFDRSHLIYSRMDRTAYDFNGRDEMSSLTTSEINFLFDGPDDHNPDTPTSFEQRTSHTDNYSLIFMIMYKFGNLDRR